MERIPFVIFLLLAWQTSYSQFLPETNISPPSPKNYGKILARGEGEEFTIYNLEDKDKRYDYFFLNKPVDAPAGNYNLAFRGNVLTHFSVKAGGETKLNLSDFFGTINSTGDNAGVSFGIFALMEQNYIYDYFSANKPIKVPVGDYKFAYRGETLKQFSVKAGEETKIKLSDFLGSLRVSGESGTGQSGYVWIIRCRPDATFVYERTSCAGIDKPKLERSAILPIGAYEVWYSNTIAQKIYVYPGRETKLSLSRINVLKSPVSMMRFKMFLDYTDRGERNKNLLLGWSLETNNKFIDEYCRSFPTLCPALASPWTIENLMFSYDGKNANHWRLRVFPDSTTTTWDELGRTWVSGARADTGDFLSVLPGTYGIVYYDAAGKVIETQYGIDTTKGNIYQDMGITVENTD